MLSEPHWLILLIPLLWLTWIFRPESKKILILRFIVVIMLVLALSGPILKISGKEGIVIVVADRSASMPADNDRRIQETINIISEKMPVNGLLGLVSFTDRARIEFNPTRNDFSELTMHTNANGSNLNEGISLALSMIPEEMSGRIVVLSDGLWNGTEPMSSAIEAINRKIPIDYRYISRTVENDLAISYFKVPSLLEPEESFIIKAGIISKIAQNVELELLGNGISLLKTQHYLRPGSNDIRFSVKAPVDAIIKYCLKVNGSINDPQPENNIADAVSLIKGKKPVLVICNSKQSTMKRMLEQNSIKSVEKLARDFTWKLEDLAGYSAVILENVPAQLIGFGGMHNLSAWVKHMGGGLLITGGKNSFGNGGYYQSPLDDALPVSLEMRNECRKMSIAIAIVLDRSGSMAMEVSGRTKMELANIAAVSSLDLLAPMDEFCLFAVDTEPHCIVPIQDVKSKDKWRHSILSVRSEGGGIYVYDGIKAAIDMLKYSKSKTRHIILFSDACDSEKPGEYWNLLKEAEEKNITLSVIGLGKETDSDGELLKKIADLGKGCCFFTDEPQDLPRLFSQDTFIAAKSMFVDEKTDISSSFGLNTFVGSNINFKSSIDAYNICYLKPNASQIITAENEEKSPILVAWQYGLGRVACYTGVLSQEQCGEFLKGKESVQVLTGLTNWLAFDDRNILNDMMVTQKVENGNWVANIYLDPDRTRDPFTTTPVFELLCSENNRYVNHYSLKPIWESADLLSAKYKLNGNESITALLKLSDNKKLRLAPVCLMYSPEFLPNENKNGAKELKNISNKTNGKELIDATSVWDSMPPVYQNKDVSEILFFISLILFLLEISERRMALLTTIAGKLKKTNNKTISDDKVEVFIKKDAVSVDKTLQEVPVLNVKTEISEIEKHKSVEKNNMLGALKAAKKNADRRTNN